MIYIIPWQDCKAPALAPHARWQVAASISKYKAKRAVDSFFVRAGDVIQGGLFVGERLTFTG